MSTDQNNNTETRRIAEQLRSVYYGPSWLGPALVKLLADIDDDAARKHAIPDAHSILDLVRHIAAWLRIARERLSAQSDRDATDEEDWPSDVISWQGAKAALEFEVSELQKAILSFSDSRLDQRAPANEPQSYYTLLHGVIQHTAYHAGQIALLKK